MRNPKLVPYETIIRATSGEPEAVDEILGIIAKYGYPQDWNNDGKYGPERYIEAQIWSDNVIKRYL